ncbi:MAG: ADP-ribosylglycohydrolase family protein [Euryarchaeota archaeon]|nr:ADP-ribosylglycohydrolase family protein [Euryarchaeota archaeon]
MNTLNSMYGQAIGDMLGEPVEGLTREEIAMRHHTITGFLSQPSITDDTIMTHLVVRSICETGRADRRHVAQTFLRNRARIPRMGPTTAQALFRLAEDPEFTPTTGTTDGAAMRAPAIAWLFPADMVIPNTIESSVATHGSPVAIAGACAVACAVSGAIAGADIKTVVRAGVHGAREVSNDLAALILEAVSLVSQRSLEDVIDITGCGIETAEAVPAVFAIISKHHDFRSAVLAAVNLGGDADTIASMVGAIIGGMSHALPRDWIDACRGPPEAMIRESWRCVSRFTDSTGRRSGTSH